MKSHFIFGGRAFWGHVLLDLNTRIDIICLGFWVDDKIVGVYGMAAVVAEGVYQFPLVLRTMYNPRIIQLLALGDILKLEFLVKRARRVVWFVMIFISMMGGLFTFYALPWLTGKSQYAESTLFFCVIMIGMSVASGYAPFNFILMNGGFPGKQSVIAFLLVSINGIGNLILIPLLGALGAAIATSISYMVSVILLKRFSWRYLKVKV
jgi:O-antigen/teichoic acid export membrane protein